MYFGGPIVQELSQRHGMPVELHCGFVKHAIPHLWIRVLCNLMDPSCNLFHLHIAFVAPHEVTGRLLLIMVLLLRAL